MLYPKGKTVGSEYGPLIWNHYIPITYHLRVRAHALYHPNKEETNEDPN